MSGIPSEWLVHGCLKLGDMPESDRLSFQIRDALSAMYGGEPFGVWMWPQQHFKNTLWWREKDVQPFNTSYFVTVDHKRGPAFYAGITVEKGFEDPDKASRVAQAKVRSPDEFLMRANWDWHRAVSSMLEIQDLFRTAVAALRKELYIWLEFGDDRSDSRHFVITETGLYQRGGFRNVPWEDVIEFASKARPSEWGNMYLARAFSLDECTPELDIARVIEVFRALKTIRDHWRGRISGVSASRQST